MSQPLSLERLQYTYSSDERRALHDATVSAAPSCHDLTELALLGGDGEAQSSRRKSRAEILVELRDMKRRRTKYRGAAKTRNYSDVLRGVIDTQMEHYAEARNANAKNTSQNDNSKVETEQNYREVIVKKEPSEQDITETHKFTEKEVRRSSSKVHGRYQESRNDRRHTDNYKVERHTDRSKDKYKEREKTYDDYKRDRGDRRHKDDKDGYSSSSKERSRDVKDYRRSERYRDDSHRDCRNSDKYKDHSRRNDYQDYRASTNSVERYKQEYGASEKSHREEKYKRYYDYQQDGYEEFKRRFKKEKD